MPIRAQVDAYQTQIICALRARGYQGIMPMRISYQPSEKAGLSQIQGILRARHLEQGRVIVKWEININCASASFGNLDYEISVLPTLLALPTLSQYVPPVIAQYTLPLADDKAATVLIIKNCGSDLRALLRQHSAINKPEIIQRIAAALGKLHHAGWLHNDIKPSNILCNENSFITLCDFALSCPMRNTAVPMGTPAYLAPERWHGQPATVQTDIYAFGVLMYEMLAGQRPYQIDTVQAEKDKMHAWAVQHCQAPIPKLPAEYAHWQRVIEGCLAKHKNNRYCDISEVLAAIIEVHK